MPSDVSPWTPRPASSSRSRSNRPDEPGWFPGESPREGARRKPKGGDNLKALTLWQPWASLVAIGAKKIETRSWRTSHRGALLIHAAARNTRRIPEGVRRLSGWILSFHPPMDFGAILAIANLVDCVPVETIRESLSLQELTFGDYGSGRWSWLLSDVRLIVPVHCRGSQGLWNWEGDIQTAQGGGR
jgi:hypothetical protein